MVAAACFVFVGLPMVANAAQLSPACHDQPAQNPTVQAPDIADVSVTLTPSRQDLAAGDLWAVSGVVQNHSKDKAIYLVDKKTALMFAPEVYGTSTGTFALIADFPTVFYDPPGSAYKATWVCIEPGGSYAVTWRFNSPSNSTQYHSCIKPDGAGAPQEIYDGALPSVIKNYAFFYPGTFTATATIDVWYDVPEIKNETCQVFLTNSFPVTVTRDLTIGAPFLVLIFGAAIGGFVCRTLQLVGGGGGSQSGAGSSRLSRGLVIIGGYLAAVLLSGIATVLFARLATTEFPLAVKVNDIWGAIAVGFVVQFFGYPWLSSHLLNQPASASGGGTTTTSPLPDSGASTPPMPKTGGASKAVSSTDANGRHTDVTPVHPLDT
jgi:hypothetical protein